MNDYLNIDGKYYQIIYHIVFCARYRRKLFKIPHLETRFAELVREVCAQNEMQLIDAKCDLDFCYLIIKVAPSMSAGGAIAKIKGYTGRKLLSEFEEFSKTQNLWTRNYLVSTEPIPRSLIDMFREKQVTHY